MGLDPSEVFVFAGAGVSRPMPSNLPVFVAIRDRVLLELGLYRYLEADPHADPASVQVARGLLAEPFLGDLERSRLPVEEWLENVLGHAEPGAAHRALSQLAEHGARVWTVNFDHLIEDAGPRLQISAWPAEPAPNSQLLKPHGTLGGKLVVTATQVLGELPPAWRRQLSDDVAGRTVLFVGYSGNDLDFRPVWDGVLAGAREVLWFDFDDAEMQAAKRQLIPRVEQAGRLVFPGNVSPPGFAQNPSFDFVSFCIQQGLVKLEQHEVDSLLDKPHQIDWPPFPAHGPEPEAEIRATLGDIWGARAVLGRQILAGPRRRAAAGSLVRLTINHGGRPSAALLLVASGLVPPIGRGRSLRAGAHRKRLTILANRGRHRAVIRATRRPPADGASTELILRSASERYVASLDTAEATAAEALRLALAEKHNVRVAHAAYQRAMSLVWGGRLDEARDCLESQLQPYAAIAANRWVAWSNFVAAAVAVQSPGADLAEASRQLTLARSRFAAEALIDGVVAADTANLTLRRCAGALDDFLADAAELATVIGQRQRRTRFYTRGHPFAVESVRLEAAEFERLHGRGAGAARPLFEQVAQSEYPLHRSLGLLGVAMVAEGGQERRDRASRAIAVAEPFGVRYVVSRARELIDGASDADREVCFC